MNNNERLETTIQREIITIKFDGEKSISLDALCFALSTFKKLTELASNGEFKVEYRIVANREGSFEIDLLSIVNIATLLLNSFSESLTKEVLSVIREWFKIKIHLNEKPPKEIIKENGKINIMNESGNVMATSYAGARILDNATINANTICFGNCLNQDNRSGVKVKVNDEDYLNIDKNDFNKIISSESIPLEQKIHTSRAQARLIICKPDLTGDSKWDFIYNKRIQAKIEDEEFKKKVSAHTVSFSNGTQIDVDMRIETELNDENMPLLGTEKYFVEKVNDVIQPTSIDENQTKLEGI